MIIEEHKTKAYTFCYYSNLFTKVKIIKPHKSKNERKIVLNILIHGFWHFSLGSKLLSHWDAF